MVLNHKVTKEVLEIINVNANDHTKPEQFESRQ